MASVEKKVYPKVGAKPWTVLRARAANAPSTKFSPVVVASLLSMAPDSARNNVLRPMERLGIFDGEGNLTPLGQKWRIDASYAEACQTILDAVYPEDLLAFKDAEDKPDKAQINTWFSHQGLGASNAGQMAATYTMIAQRTPPDPNSQAESKASTSKLRATPVKKVAPAKADAKPASDSGVTPPPPPPPPANHGPNVHLDIQIHIPAEATADQIDQIFASMAKHLYPR
ncbi:hypothetical protein ACSMXN_16980 [Jatrophihabitans sp. DSM 45814]